MRHGLQGRKQKRKQRVILFKKNNGLNLQLWEKSQENIAVKNKKQKTLNSRKRQLNG